jgi:hypothetical protein
MVLVEGEVQGTWSHRLTGDRISISIGMFDEPGPRLQAALESEIELMASFLEAGRVKVDQVKLARPARRVAAAVKKPPAARKPAAPKPAVRKPKR